jgi:hydrogenase nickel incorporation protein HypA/HybF
MNGFGAVRLLLWLSLEARAYVHVKRSKDLGCPARESIRELLLHEIGIASSILQTVDAEARRRPASQIMAVGLRIGELSNVDKDALTFAFDALTRNSPWETLKFEIEWCPRRQKCLGCGEVFSVQNFQMDCPNCSSTATTCIGGTELEIVYLDVEDACTQP